MNAPQAQFVISIMSRDHVGIIYQVSKALSDLDGNIAQVRQSVLCGYFTMILLATFPSQVTQRDIERKLAEAALRESEEKYRRLFENSPLGIFQSTPEGQALSVNSAFAQMFGYESPAEAIQNLQNVATDLFADPNRRAELIRLMAEKPGLRTFENLYRRKDGSTFIGSLNSILVRDAQGNLIRIEGLIEDITERKRAEAALQKNNQMLLALHNVVREMGGELRLSVLSETILASAEEMLALDRGGGIYLYEAAGQIMRLVKGSGINRGREGLAVPLGECVVGQVFQTAQRLVVDDYSAWAGRTTVLIADPPSTVLGVPLFLKGEVIGVLTLIADSSRRKFSPEDVQQAEMFAAQAAIAIQNARLYEQAQTEIAERQQAEEKLHESLTLLRVAGESAKLGGWSVKLDENRVTWSDEVASIHEAPAGFSPLVAEGVNFYAPEWREKIAQVYSACAERGVPYDEELEIITTRGKRVWVRTTGEAVRDEQGQIIKVHGAFQDISARKQAEEDLRETSERLAHMLANSPTVIYSFRVENDQAQPTWISENIEAVLGFHSDAMPSIPVWSPTQQIHALLLLHELSALLRDLARGDPPRRPGGGGSGLPGASFGRFLPARISLSAGGWLRNLAPR